MVQKPPGRLSKIKRQLLEALAAEGATPGGKFRFASAVIRRALEVSGQLSSHAEAYLADDEAEEDKACERVYAALVQLVHARPGQALVEGQGNFGKAYYHPGDPPAHMKYVECRLTRLGQEYLRKSP